MAVDELGTMLIGVSCPNLIRRKRIAFIAAQAYRELEGGGS
jgi:hypothetical protein